MVKFDSWTTPWQRGEEILRCHVRPAQAKAREVIQERTRDYEAVTAKLASGKRLTAEEKTVLAAGPPAITEDGLKELDVEVQKAVLKKLQAEENAEVEKAKAEVQQRIDGAKEVLTALEEKVDEVDERHAPAVEAARQVIQDWKDEHNVAVEEMEEQQQSIALLVEEKDAVRGLPLQSYLDDFANHQRQERQRSSDYMMVGASGTDLMEITRQATRADINKGIAALNEANRKETQPRPMPSQEPELIAGRLV